MIQFDQLGIRVNGYDPVAMMECYRQAGEKNKDTWKTITHYIVFDAIVGNTDRRLNAGNWAIIMDNKTGYRQISGIYDLNRASLINKNEEMIGIVGSNINKAGNAIKNEAMAMLRAIEKVCGITGVGLWRDNMERLKVGISR